MAASDSFLYINSNIGEIFSTSEDSFLYIQSNITADQPHGFILSTDPILLVPGETFDVAGYNFLGRDDGGLMEPELRFYGSAAIGGWYEELVVSGSWTDTSVTATMPYTTPAVGFLVVYHTGPDAGPVPYSNFYGVGVDKQTTTLTQVDFDASSINWAPGVTEDTYWIGAAPLKGSFYITSKRGSPYKVSEGGVVSVLTDAQFDVSGDAVVGNVTQHIWTNATGGTFTLTFGALGPTGAIAYNAAASTVQSAINAVSGLTCTVSGSGTAADPWIVVLSEPNSPTLATANVASLTGGVLDIDAPDAADRILPDAQFPRAFHAVQKHSRLFVGNVWYGDGTQHKSRVHWSSPLEPEYWYGTDYIDFDPDDGQQITAMVPYGEGIMVFKDHSVQLLSGATEDTFNRLVLDNKIGTVSPYTVETIGGQLFFYDRDTGVWKFDGAQFTSISDKISTYLLEEQRYEQAYKANAYTYRDQYVLSLPFNRQYVSDPLWRTFVYDVALESWSEHDLLINDATVVGDGIYAGMQADDGVYRLDYGATDNGVAIDAWVKTPWVSMGSYSQKQRLRNVDVAFENHASGGSVTTGFYTDFDETTADREQTEAVAGGDEVQKIIRISGVGRKRFDACQLRFDNVSGSDFQLNRVTLLWNARQRNRGVVDAGA